MTTVVGMMMVGVTLGATSDDLLRGGVVSERGRGFVKEEMCRWTEMDYSEEWLGEMPGRKYRFI